MVVINKTLEKIQNEFETIGRTISTNDPLKFMGIFLIIISLIIISLGLFLISNYLGRGAELVKAIAKVFLFATLLVIPHHLIDY
jgi:hypothetical protein